MWLRFVKVKVSILTRGLVILCNVSTAVGNSW
jgi:hypothetical protein